MTADPFDTPIFRAEEAKIAITKRTKQVPGIGPPGCKICIVGEAPGSHEIFKGEPFVGPSGELLNRCLARAGIIREQCYITNVIKEQCPNNDASRFIDLSKKHVVETPIYREYVEVLYKELANKEFNVVIAVGNTALYALTGKRGIMKYRGSILLGIPVQSRKVIPIIHPAAALREYLFGGLIIKDLARAKVESQDYRANLPTYDIVLEPSFEQAMNYVQILNTDPCNEVATDIEVINRELSCISFSPNGKHAICIPFKKHGENYWRPDEELLLMRAIDSLMKNREVSKVGQHITFDSGFLLAKYSIKIFPIEDTMIGQAILMPDHKKGLDMITSLYTREPYYKDEGKQYMKDPTAYSERDFWIYNAKDSLICMEAWKKIKAELYKRGLWETYCSQRDLVPILVWMQERGIKIDVPGKEKASSDAAERLDILMEEFQSRVGPDVSPSSTKQLCEYFYGTLNIRPYMRKRGKGPSTPTVDEKALKMLSAKGVEVASIILEMRSVAKAKSTYYDMKIDNDGRLRSSYNPVGTKNGRLSSSKNIFGTGGNFQNITKDMKRFMTADDNYVGYELDLSQAENQIVAYLSGCETMIDAFKRGVDMHSKTASLLLGKPISEISDEEGSSTIGSGKRSERFWGKTANHGLNYDLTAYGYSLHYEVQLSEAKHIVEMYHRAYPEIRRWHARVREELSENKKTLINLLGRSRMFMDRWGPELHKEAYNFVPQSTVADMINRWGLIYIYYDQGMFKWVEILNQVHDSIVIQIPICVGWPYHCKVLQAIRASLQQNLKTFDGVEFSIPLDITMFSRMDADSKEGTGAVIDTISEDLLEEAHGKLSF